MVLIPGSAQNDTWLCKDLGLYWEKYPHVIDLNVLQDLTEVDIPHSLVVPHLRGQDNGSQHQTFPVAGVDVNLCVCQQSFQVHLRINTQECQDTLQHMQVFSVTPGSSFIQKRFAISMPALLYLNLLPTGGTERILPDHHQTDVWKSRKHICERCHFDQICDVMNSDICDVMAPKHNYSIPDQNTITKTQVKKAGSAVTVLPVV